MAFSWLAMWCLAATLLLGLNASATESPLQTCAAGSAGCAAGNGKEDMVLLQAKVRRHEASPGDCPLPVEACHAPKRLSDVAGKSIYLILVDRFARCDSNDTPCDNEDNAWCGGTLKGITQHLDYIQGMGFDCVWLTPVVKQFEGKDGTSGYGSHGYWAMNWYEIDPHFGTSEDFKELSAELHKRDMCLVYDFVTNHVMPIHSTADVEKVYPFNKTEYFHTLNISDSSGDFNAYAGHQGCHTLPPPVQALWSGAQCSPGVSCACYKCPHDVGFGKPCNVTPVFDPESPCPPDPIFPYCMAGDYDCVGYNETVTWDGWFYDLGDLKHEHKFVRDELLKWGRHMVDTYDIDVVRLDTAAYQPWWFLSNLQEAVCVPILGEVTATNMTFHANFEANPPPGGKPVLKGVLNFPLTYAANPAFCGALKDNHWKYAASNLTRLGHRMTEQLTSGLYANLDTLGNQVDNHDMARVAEVCHQDMSLIMNHLTWNMLAKGAPTIYYGTEVGELRQRNSLWQYGWKTDTPLYKWLALMNQVRRLHALGTASSEVKAATENTLVFTRGEAWVFLNNYGEEKGSVTYCAGIPRACPGKLWVDALADNKPAKFDDQGRFMSCSSLPSLLVQIVKPCSSGEAFGWMKNGTSVTN